MSKYDKLKNEYDALKTVEAKQLQFAEKGLDEISSDAKNTSELYKNADTILTEIDEKFAEITKLNKHDMAFLFFAVALQCVRQYFITNRNDRLSDQEAAKNTKGHNEEHSNRKRGEWYLPTAPEIIANPVPYDASRQTKIVKQQEALKGAGDMGHRLVLGHDPILGWVFGTANIATSTLTNWKMESYHIKSKAYSVGSASKVDYLSSPVSTMEMLEVAFDRFFKNGIEGYSVLATSLAKEWIHLKSDIGTKNSLPLPIVSTISPDLANRFADYGLDMGNLMAFSKQAIYAEAINVIIGILHGMYCFYTYKTELPENTKLKESLYFSHSENNIDILELSKVRTRKILSLSNLIATSSNIIAVAIMEIVGAKTGNADLMKKGMQYLDIGGLAATTFRLISDTKFISEVKKEFVEKEWQKAVLGDDYQFVAEVSDMSKKDIKKGIEIQAKADAAKAEKLADGIAVHAELLKDIKSTQSYIHSGMDIVLKDKIEKEAEELFGLRTKKKICDLDYTEKRVLGATLYTLIANSSDISELQRMFYKCVEQFGIVERTDTFNFALLKNIDSFSDRKIILKAICVFLFLNNCQTTFIDDPNYSWLSEFTSKEDVRFVCEEIEKEFSILGGEGMISGYISSPAPVVEKDNIIDDVIEFDEEHEYSYSALLDLIANALMNEKAFGKQIEPFSHILEKELQKDCPNISSTATLGVTKISNGYLVFTTYGMYFRAGNILRGEYICLPYEKIAVEQIATAEGKTKGTRKLIIPYMDTDNKLKYIDFDDTKVEEEKLRELLINIRNTNYTHPKTDRFIDFFELEETTLVLYLRIVATALSKGNRSLSELFFFTKEVELLEHWEEIIDFFDEEANKKHIEEFITKIPYPSELELSSAGMHLFMRTLCRTNTLENKEITLMSQYEEACAKKFDMLGIIPDSSFSKLIKEASNSKRLYSIEALNAFKNEITDNFKYGNSILEDIDLLIEKLKQEEEAKNNTPLAKLRRTVQDDAIPAAMKMVEKAEAQIKQIKFPIKKDEDKNE